MMNNHATIDRSRLHTNHLPEPRDIRWTDAAKTDLMWMQITRDEWRVIKSEVNRLASINRVELDSAVCRVSQTDGNWLRLKIREPSQIRVFFSASKRAIVVQAVLRRTERTYDICEILWETFK